MPFTTRQTPQGQVVVGDLPADFLRVDQPQATSSNQQISADERTARMLQAQQAGYSANTAPNNVVGRLSISITQAKLAKNYSITKMDPYCRIRVGHAVFETPTASGGGKNPRWSKTVRCYLPVGVEHVYVEVFDEKTFQVDDRVAWAHIDIPSKALSGETVDDWYPLNGKQGDGKEGMINLVFSFAAVEQTTQVLNPMPMMPQVVMMPGAPGMYYPPYQPAFQPVYPTAGQMVPEGAAQQPMRPPQPVQLSEDDLNQIKDMFPNIDMDVIKSVAESQRGNKDATINALLSMESS